METKKNSKVAQSDQKKRAPIPKFHHRNLRTEALFFPNPYPKSLPKSPLIIIIYLIIIIRIIIIII